MSVIAAFSTRCRRRLRAEDGSTLLVALSILLITSLLTGGLLTLILSDSGLTNTDVQGKRAYAAAQSGAQYYLGQLNASASSATWWQTCSNDSTSSAVSVPGTAGESYTYQPVVNSCSGTNAVGTVLDPNTGLLRMKFTGYAGTNGQHRTIVADFRPLTPLSYLWFTVRETVDPTSATGVADNCNGATYSSSNPPTNSGCWLTWGATDVMNGPMYTQDQFYISSSGSGPTFGRNAQDTIAANGSTTSVCVTPNSSGFPTTHACPSSVTMKGTPKPGAGIIPLPDQNQQLSTDASTYGIMLNPGTTTLTLALNASGQTVIQSGVTCTGTSSSTCVTTAANGTALAGLNLSTIPVIYAPSPSSPSCPTYDPSNVSYSTVSGGIYSGSSTGACGDLYVSGTYSSSLTLAAADDVIVTGNLLNSTDTNATGTQQLSGAATLGLVANQYVRVYRPVSNPSSSGTNCASTTATPGNITIDGAILALAHSFAVDNYDCGTPATLTIHGALAQQYRGAVGTVNPSTGTVLSGYSKNYNYDNRFKYVMPPYVFDLQNTSWNVVRQTEGNGS